MALMQLSNGSLMSTQRELINNIIDEVNSISNGTTSVIDSTARTIANSAREVADEAIPKANISSAIDSTSITNVANSKAVKDAYDRGSLGINNATTAQTKADNAMPKSGGDMTGALKTMVSPVDTTEQARNAVVYPAGTILASIVVSAGTIINILK